MVNSTKLNLGGGVLKEKGWRTLDINPDANPDILTDLNDGIPLRDSSVSEIRAYHVIEHISDITKFMSECWRVGKNGCVVHIRYPHFSSRSAYADPTHRHWLGHCSLEYYEDKHLSENQRIFPAHLKLRLLEKRAHCFGIRIESQRLIALLENLRIPIQEIEIKFMVVKKAKGGSVKG